MTFWRGNAKTWIDGKWHKHENGGLQLKRTLK